MTQAMTLHQAARWAERNDALYINGDFNEPMCAVWSSETHRAVCIGSWDKCRAYITQHCDSRGNTPTSGLYYAPRGNSHGWLRFDPLDLILDGMDESEAEANLPEQDYRCEAWA